MTITSNSDYTTITVTSTNLMDLAPIDTIELQGKINCSGSYSYTVAEVDINIVTGEFTVDLDELFGTTTLADSIYSFILVINNDDDTVIKEYSCLFVDNNIKCDVVDCVVEKNNIELQLDYYLLTRAQNCDCDCTDLCTIYNRLKNEQVRCKDC